MAPVYECGTYRATITGQRFDDGQYGWQFVLTIQPIANPMKGERTVYLSLTDENGDRAKYADRSIDAIRHLGFTGDADLAKLDPDKSGFFSFIGKEVEVKCDHKNDKERWYIMTPRSGQENTSPPTVIASKFRALFGKELKKPTEVSEEVVPPVTQATAEEQAAADADPIPF